MLPHINTAYCPTCDNVVSYEHPLGACITDPGTNMFVFGEAAECPICRTVLNAEEVDRFQQLKDEGHTVCALL